MQQDGQNKPAPPLVVIVGFALAAARRCRRLPSFHLLIPADLTQPPTLTIDSQPAGRRPSASHALYAARHARLSVPVTAHSFFAS